MDEQPPKKKGIPIIKDFVKNLPHKPGVYRMYDEKGDVLYIGKAKDLKNRVSSYTRGKGHNNRITKMIQLTCHMEFIITNSEIEALLLEASLIKNLNPRYNILLRDDKSLPYILITEHYRAPALTKHRGVKSEKGQYFGPFASPGAVNETIATIQRAFLLRVCSDSAFESRKRPCLLYQMKRCSAPCTCEISDKNYTKLVQQAKDFLRGKNQDIIEQLTAQMEKASSHLEYEQAAVYRDRLASLKKLIHHQSIHLTCTQEADIFAIARQGALCCIQVFFYRYGQNWGNRSYFPKVDSDLSEGDILQSFIMQFYADKTIPKLILLAHQVPEQTLVKQALSLKANSKIVIRFPERGEKKTVVDHALFNAKEALARKLAETGTQDYLFRKFSERFNLKRIPERIEVYDNSHLMGKNATGAMIVATKEGFIKNQYRKFNIRSKLTPGDDYGMMQEVIQRRFERLIKETPLAMGDNKQQITEDLPATSWPDVILIDGGRGQLSVVTKTIEALGLSQHVDIIAIAKGKDRNAGREYFFQTGKEPFQLPERDEVLYFVQRLRDEAHRFAIGVHRSKRQKELFANPLNEIENIGAARKRALLKHFGSAKAIRQASFQELAQVKGISETLAKKILNQLKS